MHRDLCPCTSSFSYEICCKPFHEGALPKNAVQLMRSRFSAYALDKPDYIMKTTHPFGPKYFKNANVWKKRISEFSQISTFIKLVILNSKEEGNEATVTFTAYMSQKGRNTTFTEKSDFKKIEDRWLYFDGQAI